VIHYHGLDINPDTACEVAVRAGHAFVPFTRRSRQIGLVVASCQSFAIDNGAFSAWRSGEPVKDWTPYYEFAAQGKRTPSCDFAVIPDVIDGTEADNDALLERWPLPHWFGAPVWHLHESMQRLARLAALYPRVCLGSSGDYAQIGTEKWWRQMGLAMRTICDDAGRPACRLHGLRMLDPEVFTRFPFASADSVNIGRNIGIDQHWQGPYMPPTKESRVQLMRSRIESQNAPPVYDFMPTQGQLTEEW
jgi:hypothetical protein